MRVLLDTHTLIWWANGNPRLSKRAFDLISDSTVEVLISAVIGWEIAIKAALGALRLSVSPNEFVRGAMTVGQMIELPISVQHGLHVYHLPPLHKDPFDRLLVAQAQLEQASIVTDDPMMPRYGIAVEW